ncbi:MAG: hypothetical protein JSR44_09485 [Spirochaetes bacterium]|nr:hypothetical protein [Spirochaetota bacterium]
MQIRKFGEGFSCNLSGGQKEGREDASYFFEPEILAHLIESNKFDQGVVRIHPTFGVSILVQKRRNKDA